MKFPLLFSFYLARQFLVSLGIVASVLLGISLLFDMIEMIRRIPSEAFSFARILEFSLLKLPYLAQMLLPFMILLASLLTFVRMTRTSELIVARAAGISVWQFLMPAVVTSFLFGIVFVICLNPLAALFLARMERLEARILQGQTSELSVSDSGLWLRQSNAQNNGKMVVHALRVQQPEMVLYDTMFLVFDEDDRFVERVDAPIAKLAKREWVIEDAIVNRPGKIVRRERSFSLPTTLSAQHIQESFSSPQTLGFWELPGFIAMLQKAGFSALRHRLYWYSLFTLPFLFGAMVYLGAAFSLHLPRQGKNGVRMVGGVLMGLGFKFLNDVVAALGLSGSIPILFAAWAPVCIATLLGVGLLLHLEDG